MNIIAILRSATLGKTERLRPMFIWTMAEYAMRGAPYGILLLTIVALFKILQSPGEAVNFNYLVFLCVALFISLVILYKVSQKAYFTAYYDTYELCAEGRLFIGNHLRKLSMGFYNARDPGKIGSYLINDYAHVEFLLSHVVPQLIGAFAMPLVLLSFLAYLNWKLALVAAIVIPLALPFSHISNMIIRYFGEKHQSVKVKTSSRLLEYIQGIRFIKAFNLTGSKFERLDKALKELKDLSIKLEASAGPTILLSMFILMGGSTIIIFAGLSLLQAGEISLPVYVMFLILGTRLYEPLIQALLFLGLMNYHQLSVERIEDLRTTPVMCGEDPSKKPERYDIEFNDVSFHYHDTDVVKNVSLSIPEHSLVAFVGPSGSGKTTMTRLIARFWDVSQGAIHLGGHDVRQYDPADVLASISMVFQEVYLFNDTILNNIKVGKKDASMEEVIAAAKAARCHDFIDKLPDGYDTMVGEGGSTLSGGEKQRVSIARAILKDAPIILLDEATALLDPENELHIQEAIDSLVKRKTVVVIAHRLNTVMNADQIIVLDEGKVVESGTHDYLIEAQGLYSQMWEEQYKTRQWTFK